MSLKLYLLFSLSLFAALPSLAQDAIKPSTFRIKDVTSSGSACRPGTTAVNISDDKEAFTVAFSSFVAEKIPNGRVGRVACNLDFKTEQDANWEFGVISMTVRGFADLEAGVTGTQVLNYGSKSAATAMKLVLKGPYADNYIHSENIPFSSIKWSGCKKQPDQNNFTVSAAATVIGGGSAAAGLLTVDSIDGQLEQVYELAWRRCDKPKASHMTSCKVSVNERRSVIVSALGNSALESETKAKIRLKRRCLSLSRAFKTCSQIAPACTTTAL